MKCDFSDTYCTACISYLHTYGAYPKSCVADEAAGQSTKHAINCPCDQCRPDLATKRANQAFHAELVKLNRNVEGLTGVVEKLAEAVGIQANVEMAKVNLGQLEEQTKRFEKVEPKKAEGSNEGGLGERTFAFNESNGQWLTLNRGTVYRVGEDGTVSQWTKMLGEVTVNEARGIARLFDAPDSLVWAILEHFARSRGLMP